MHHKPLLALLAAAAAAGIVVLTVQLMPTVDDPAAEATTPPAAAAPTAEEIVSEITSPEFTARPDDEKDAYLTRAAEQLDERALWAALRQRREDEPPSREERRERWRTIGPLMRKLRDKRMNDYFAATKEKQKELLDQDIDHMLAMREQREARRQQRPPRETRQTTETKSTPSTRSTASDKSDPPRGRGRRFTPARVRERIESTTPEERARREAYWKALRDRMRERGVEFRRRGPRR